MFHLLFIAYQELSLGPWDYELFVRTTEKNIFFGRKIFMVCVEF